MHDGRTDLDRRRAAFLTGAENYDLYRPEYPEAAIEWVVGRSRRRIVDVGCGPGTLTAQLRAFGHDVLGIDRSMAMLRVARTRRLSVVNAAVERLPLPKAAVDVVIAGTAFHWFDHELAVPEMRRVLFDYGTIGLLTNMRDESVPWVSALSHIIGSEAAMAATLGGAQGMHGEFTAALERDASFTSTEWRIFDHSQQLSPDDLAGLVRSRSYIAILPEEERAQLLARVRRLCSEHEDLRGKTSFSLPYKTHVCRSMAA